ncbi:hypothetical protein HHI36_016409 [Cryptolaemus montrouzieri]|uniref:Cytochrome P450 n=1 Tax=Cryptolaemus montrouzieri TaxID=559131 RepID=A0ABD2NJU9_9CUCU
MYTSTMLLLSIVVLALIYIYFKFRHWIYIVKKVNEFPGRRGFPIIGNMMDFLGSSDEVFLEIRKLISEFATCGTCSGWLFLYPAIGVFGPEDMERFLGSVANNTKAMFYDGLIPWLGEGLLISSGKKWQKRRKMLTPTLHFNILQKFLKVFTKESKNFVKNLKQNSYEEIDVIPVVSVYTLNSICETALGISLNDNKDGENYRRSVHGFGNIMFTRISRTWLFIEFIYRFTRTYVEQNKVTRVLHNFSRNIIEKRKNDTGDIFKGYSNSYGKKRLALLDQLILAQKNGEDIDDEGIREEVDTFMFEDKLYEEIHSVFGDDDREPTNTDLLELKYIDRCIKESLRLYPSVPIVARKVGEDFKTQSGLVIPKGCMAVGCIYDMHRRADLYPEPEKFDPDRFLLENVVKRHPYAYIPFSAGPRNCIGQKFAMMEMKCFLIEIMRNYILEPIDTPETILCIFDIVLRTKNPIRVAFRRRK